MRPGDEQEVGMTMPSLDPVSLLGVSLPGVPRIRWGQCCPPSQGLVRRGCVGVRTMPFPRPAIVLETSWGSRMPYSGPTLWCPPLGMARTHP